MGADYGDRALAAWLVRISALNHPPEACQRLSAIRNLINQHPQVQLYADGGIREHRFPNSGMQEQMLSCPALCSSTRLIRSAFTNGSSRSSPSIVIMAGLPGTGKSTISRALAAESSGVVLDKDSIRAALFPEAWMSTPRSRMISVWRYFYRPPLIFLADVPRRPSSSSMGVLSHSAINSTELRSGQQRRGAGSNSSIRSARMRRRNTDSRPAPTQPRIAISTRGSTLKARFENINYPKLTLNTEQSLEASINQCLLYLRAQ